MAKHHQPKSFKVPVKKNGKETGNKSWIAKCPECVQTYTGIDQGHAFTLIQGHLVGTHNADTLDSFTATRW